MARSTLAAHIRTTAQFVLVSAMIGASAVIPVNAYGAPSLLDALRQAPAIHPPATQPVPVSYTHLTLPTN